MTRYSSRWRRFGRESWELLAIGLLAGCAAVPPDSGFDAVRADIQARTGHELRLAEAGERDREAIEARLQQPLTLFDAVELALLNNPQLQATLTDLQVSAADWIDAVTPSNPSLALTVLDPSEAGSRSIEAELLAPLVELLLRSPSRDLARLEGLQVRAEVIEAVIGLTGDTERAWFDYLAAREKARIAELMLEAAEVGRLLAGRFADAGNITPLETALHDDAAGVAQAALEEARLALEQARLVLGSLMGLAPDVDWQPAAGLPTIAAQWPEADLLRERALAEHPSLQVAALELDKLSQALSLERRFRWFGDVDVGVAWERETDRSELYGLALELSLPIFDRNQAEIARAQAVLGRAGWSQEAARSRVAQELALATAALETAARRARIYRDTIIPARRQAVDFVLREYNYMITGVFDLIEVREREFEAWEGYVDAVTEFWLAAADLRRAVGGRLDIPAGEPVQIPALQAADPMDHSGHEGMRHGSDPANPSGESADSSHEDHHDHTP